MALRILRRAADKARKVAASKAKTAAKKSAAKAKAAAKSQKASQLRASTLKTKDAASAKRHLAGKKNAKKPAVTPTSSRTPKQREKAASGVRKSKTKAPTRIKSSSTKKTGTVKSNVSKSETLRRRQARRGTKSTLVSNSKLKAQVKRSSRSKIDPKVDGTLISPKTKETSTKGAKSPTGRKVVSRTTKAPARQKPTKKGIPVRKPANRTPAKRTTTGRTINDSKSNKLKNTSPTGNKRQTPKGTNPSQKVTGDAEQAARKARGSASDSFDSKARAIISQRLRDSGLRGGDPKYKKLKRDLEKKAKEGSLRVRDAAESKTRAAYKANLNQSPGVAYAGDTRNSAGFRNKVGNRDSSNRMTGSKVRKLSEDMSARKARGELKPIKQSPKYKPSQSRQSSESFNRAARNFSDSKKKAKNKRGR